MSEEAEMEIMALESIFGDEMEIIDPGRKIAVEVADPSDGVMRLELKMEFPADYPESVPIFNVRGIKGLTRAQVDPLHTLLGEKCEEMLGMQMVFELTTYIQEWMANGAKDPNDKGEGFEAPTVIETKKKHGTQVTRENFAEWIAAFTAEMEKAEKKGKTTGAAAAPVADGTRLTGRQIFEKAAGVDWELFGDGDIDEDDLPDFEDDAEE